MKQSQIFNTILYSYVHKFAYSKALFSSELHEGELLSRGRNFIAKREGTPKKLSLCAAERNPLKTHCTKDKS